MSISDPTGGERQDGSQHRDDGDKPTQGTRTGSGPPPRKEPMSPGETVALNVFHDLQLAYVRQSQQSVILLPPGCRRPKRPDTEACGGSDSIRNGSGSKGSIQGSSD